MKSKLKDIGMTNGTKSDRREELDFLKTGEVDTLSSHQVELFREEIKKNGAQIDQLLLEAYLVAGANPAGDPKK